MGSEANVEGERKKEEEKNQWSCRGSMAKLWPERVQLGDTFFFLTDELHWL